MSPNPGPPRPSMADVLQLPDASRTLMLWLLKQDTAVLAEAVTGSGLDESATRSVLDALIAGGFVEQQQSDGVVRFKALIASRRNRHLPGDIWKNLGV
jgi:DNA-binding IclR family transcriptional regulator